MSAACMNGRVDQDLSLIRGGPIECEAQGQGTSHSSQPFDRFCFSANTAYFELPLDRNSNFDLIPRPKAPELPQRLREVGWLNCFPILIPA
jgi:hypothetical protein